MLLLFSAAEICSAAETTFGGNYSMQLPAGWTAKAGKDNAVIGEANGVNFTANAFPTKMSAEEIMEKAIAVAEKRAGYKLIEKGSVKTSGGRTAQLFRFQVDEGKGPFMGANYYFKTETDVVALVFGISAGVPKTIKNEIEAMVDSVKVTTAAAQDDSWLTTPADKSKESSKASGTGNSEIAGKYVSTQQPNDYILLKADGTFSFQITGESGTSTYTRNGTTITLKFGDDPDDAKLEKDALVDSSGKRWVKSTAPADKSKESSKATGAGDSEIAGKYVSTQQPSDYILLKADGTFSFQITGESGNSTYTRNGTTITLKFGDDPDDAKLEKDALVDSSGKRWVKSTAAEKSKKDSKTDRGDDSDGATRVLQWMKVAGKYIYKPNAANYIVLKADGTFSIQQKDISRSGTYTVSGATITFKFTEGDEDSVKLDKDTMIDKDGDRWSKKP